MKLTNVFLLMFILSAFIYGSCRKNKTPKEDIHNHVLTSKTLDQIRQAIKGNWYVVRSTVCGVTGCQTTYANPDTADVLSFLSNDTLKQTGHGGAPIYRYEKADSIKATLSYNTNQPSWIFYFSTPLIFTLVRNDTLIAETGYGEVGLIKKP